VVVNLPTEEAMTRAVRRAVETGRYVPTDTLRKAHARVSVNIEGLTDADFIRSIVMFDNEVPFGEPPIRFAEVTDGELTVFERSLLDRFYAKGDELAEREAFDRTIGAIQEADMSGDDQETGEDQQMTMPENPIRPDRWTYWEPLDWVDFLSREPVEIVTEDGRLLDDAGRFVRDLSDEEMERRRAIKDPDAETEEPTEEPTS
jgi:hypothetical protein